MSEEIDLSDYLVWYWAEGNRICGSCKWLVMAEKYYYVCIGCGLTQEKQEWRL